MKEYRLNYMLDSALRSKDKNPLNLKGLPECYNLVKRQILEGYTSITDPFDGAVNISWPFPQLFLLNYGSFILCMKNVIYNVVDWAISDILQLLEMVGFGS